MATKPSYPVSSSATLKTFIGLGEGSGMPADCISRFVGERFYGGGRLPTWDATGFSMGSVTNQPALRFGGGGDAGIMWYPSGVSLSTGYPRLTAVAFRHEMTYDQAGANTFAPLLGWAAAVSSSGSAVSNAGDLRFSLDSGGKVSGIQFGNSVTYETIYSGTLTNGWYLVGVLETSATARSYFLWDETAGTMLVNGVAGVASITVSPATAPRTLVLNYASTTSRGYKGWVGCILIDGKTYTGSDFSTLASDLYASVRGTYTPAGGLAWPSAGSPAIRAVPKVYPYVGGAILSSFRPQGGTGNYVPQWYVGTSPSMATDGTTAVGGATNWIFDYACGSETSLWAVVGVNDGANTIYSVPVQFAAAAEVAAQVLCGDSYVGTGMYDGYASCALLDNRYLSLCFNGIGGTTLVTDWAYGGTNYTRARAEALAIGATTIRLQHGTNDSGSSPATYAAVAAQWADGLAADGIKVRIDCSMANTSTGTTTAAALANLQGFIDAIKALQPTHPNLYLGAVNWIKVPEVRGLCYDQTTHPNGPLARAGGIDAYFSDYASNAISGAKRWIPRRRR